MDNRVLERIVIGILLLLNLFLAALALMDRVELRRSNRETTEQVLQTLRDNGITAAEGAVEVREAPKRVTLVRDDQKETELAQKLLGKAEPQEQGGRIVFYRTEKGQAVFRGSGEMTALYVAGAVPLRGGAAKTTLRLLQQLGLDGELTGPVAEDSPAAEVRCAWNGYPVYNAILQFDYSDDCLYMISGNRVFDNLSGEEDGARMNSVTALLRFVELVKQDGIICSRLNAVRPGYLQTVEVSGESSLSPVWRIETDTGVFLINAETGLMETAAA